MHTREYRNVQDYIIDYKYFHECPGRHKEDLTMRSSLGLFLEGDYGLRVSAKTRGKMVKDLRVRRIRSPH